MEYIIMKKQTLIEYLKELKEVEESFLKEN